MFLAEVVVHGPTDILFRGENKAEHFVLVTIERFSLLRAIGDPIVDAELVVELIVKARTHVVERQKIKPVGARIVDLILSVVALHA